MLNNIQVLRGAAALLVVFFHLQIALNQEVGGPVGAAFAQMGVDIFFVISGVVMVVSNRDLVRTPLQFWKARLIRIVPIYWLSTLVLLALFAVGFHPVGLRVFDLGDVIGSFLFLPVMRADGWPLPILTVGWTLIYEMLFYALFGATLALKSLKATVAIVSAVFLAFATIGTFSHFPFEIQYYLNCITLEFVAGCLIGYWAVTRRADAPKRPLLAVAMMAIAIIPVVYLEYAAPGQTPLAWTRVIGWGGPALVIVGGAVLLELSGVVSRSPAFMLLGASSYSLYLFHSVILQAEAKAGGVAGRILHMSGGAFAIAVGVAALAGAVGAAILIYLFVEKPITNFLRGRREEAAPAPHMGLKARLASRPLQQQNAQALVKQLGAFPPSADAKASPRKIGGPNIETPPPR